MVLTFKIVRKLVQPPKSILNIESDSSWFNNHDFFFETLLDDEDFKIDSLNIHKICRRENTIQ